MLKKSRSVGFLLVIYSLITPVTNANKIFAQKSVNDDYRDALRLLGQSKIDQAARKLMAIISAEQLYGPAYKKLVEVYKTQNDLVPVKGFLDSLLTVNEHQAYVHFGLGWLSENEQKYDEAVKHYQRAHELGCRYGPAYSGLAAAFLRSKAIEEGIAYFNTVIIEDSTNAWAVFGLGSLFGLQRKWPDAIVLYRKAIRLKPDLLEPYRYAVSAHRNMQNYDDAIKLGEQGLEISRRQKDLEFEGEFSNTLGVTYWYKNEYAKAATYYERALQIFKDIGHKRGVARQLGNLAIVYENLGDYNKAIEWYTNSLLLAREIGSQSQESSTLGNLAIAYRSLGRYAEATESYLKAIALAREVQEKAPESQHLLNLGVLRQKLGDFDGAEAYFKSALQIGTEINYDLLVVYAIKNLGDLYAELERFPEALQYYQQTLEKARIIKDQRIEGVTLLYLGYVFERQNAYVEAHNNYQRALTIARDLKHADDELNALNRLGGIRIKLGKPEEAETYLKKALELGKAYSNPESTWEAYAGLGDVYTNTNPEKALQQLERAIDEIEDVRGRLFTPEQSSGFFQSKLQVYERTITLLMQLHETNPEKNFDHRAFNYAEKAKARALLDLMNVGQLFQNLQQISAESRQRLLNIHSQLENQRAQLAQAELNRESETADNDITRLHEGILALETEFDRYMEDFTKTYPDFYRLTSPKFLSVQELQKKVIGPDQTLIEYFIGEENSVVWVISKKRFSSHRLSITGKELRNKLAETSSLFERPEPSLHPDAVEADFKPAQPVMASTVLHANALHELYKSLMLPIMHQVPENEDLIIIPHDVLFYVPFEMLVTKLEASKIEYLVQRHAISYSASAGLLNPELKTRRDAGNQLLAIGISDFSQRRPSELKNLFKSLLERFREDDLVRLEYAEKEAQDIATNFGKSTVLLGERATEQRFKQEAENYNMIHFATHNLIDDRQPMYSKIVLAPASAGSQDDGYLHAFEVFNQKLNADLVVLSACNTGLGRFVKGEGLMGISRAFMYAGVPSLVVSLWPVEDESTAYLMSQFYKYLASGEAKNVALQKAKIDMIRSDLERNDPFYWAPFVLIGDWK